MRYLISYDLATPADYQTITEALEDLGAERRLESVWILEDSDPENKEKKLRTRLKARLAKFQDKLIVVTLARGTNTNVVRGPRRPVRKLEL